MSFYKPKAFQEIYGTLNQVFIYQNKTPTKPAGRKCCKCKKSLSIYNKNEQCHFHTYVDMVMLDEWLMSRLLRNKIWKYGGKNV